MVQTAQGRQLDRKPRIDSAMTCAEAFTTIALHCLAQISQSYPKACAGDATAIHRMRIALTRFRAAQAFCAPMVDDAAWPKLKADIKWFNRHLGAARDLDSAVEHARRLRLDGKSIAMRLRSLAARADRRHRRLSAALQTARFQLLMQAARSWGERGPWLQDNTELQLKRRRRPFGGYCRKRMQRWLDKLVRNGRDLEDMSAGRRHRFRIKVKRFRYMAEILPARGTGHDHLKRLRRLHAPGRRLQSALGDLGDLRRFRSLSILTAKPDYQKHKKRLLKKAMRAYRELAAQDE